MLLAAVNYGPAQQQTISRRKVRLLWAFQRIRLWKGPPSAAGSKPLDATASRESKSVATSSLGGCSPSTAPPTDGVLQRRTGHAIFEAADACGRLSQSMTRLSQSSESVNAAPIHHHPRASFFPVSCLPVHALVRYLPQALARACRMYTFYAF